MRGSSTIRDSDPQDPLEIIYGESPPSLSLALSLSLSLRTSSTIHKVEGLSDANEYLGDIIVV